MQHVEAIGERSSEYVIVVSRRCYAPLEPSSVRMRRRSSFELELVDDIAKHHRLTDRLTRETDEVDVGDVDMKMIWRRELCMTSPHAQ